MEKKRYGQSWQTDLAKSHAGLKTKSGHINTGAYGNTHIKEYGI